MNNVYTLKQILFALRKEYLKVEKELEELKKYFILNDKKSTIDLNLSAKFNDLIVNLNLKKILLDKIMLKFLGYSYNSKSYFLNYKIDEKYYYKKQEVFSILNVDQLKQAKDKLIKSEFLKGATWLNLELKKDNINYSLFIGERGLRLQEKNNYFDDAKLRYTSKSDKIIMKNQKRIITPDYVEEILNFSFNDENMNEYIRKIIDNYEEKEIQINDDFRKNKVELEIIEEPKKLILQPKK